MLRKAVHLSMCLGLFLCYLSLGAHMLRVILVIGIAVYVLLELMRIGWKGRSLWSKAAATLARPDERVSETEQRLASVSALASSAPFPFLWSPLCLGLGILLASFLAPAHVALVLLCVGVGDSTATLVGMSFGGYAIGKKHLVGTCAAILFVGLLAFAMSNLVGGVWQLEPLSIAIALGVFVLCDILPLGTWDNLVLPLALFFLLRS